MLSSAELLVEHARFGDNDLLGWNVGRYYTKITIRGWLGKIADLLFSSRQFKLLISVRLVFGLAMIVQSGLGGSETWLLAAAFVLTFLIAVRSVFGLDGAFQMNLVTLAGLWVNASSPKGSIASSAGLWFVAVQLGLSYAIAGLSKIPTRSWRDGTALTGILGTGIYGHRGLFRVVTNYPYLAVALSWAVMSFEISFIPLCLFRGKMMLAVMMVGVFFHLSNAVFMGLNGFFVSFVAAYPVAWTLMNGRVAPSKGLGL